MGPQSAVHVRSAVNMTVERAVACSLQFFLFLTVLYAGNLLHMKKCLTKVSCLSLQTNRKYLARGEVPNFFYALVKRFGSGSQSFYFSVFIVTIFNIYYYHNLIRIITVIIYWYHW